MARRRSKNYPAQRDFSTQSLRDVLSIKIRPAPVLIPLPYPTPQSVRTFGDRRMFKPDRSVAPPASVTRSASRVVAKPRGKLHQLRFADPRLVSLCARRKIRREVLFAFKRTRKGSGAKKRRNFWSDISC